MLLLLEISCATPYDCKSVWSVTITTKKKEITPTLSKKQFDACRGSFSDLFFPRADCLVIEYDVEAKRFREFHFTISPAASDHFATLVSKSKTVLFIRVQEGKAFGKTIAVKFNRPVFNSNLL